jgi:hypothetical protein
MPGNLPKPTNAFPVNESQTLGANISDKFGHGSFKLFQLLEYQAALHLFYSIFNASRDSAVGIAAG